MTADDVAKMRKQIGLFSQSADVLADDPMTPQAVLLAAEAAASPLVLLLSVLLRWEQRLRANESKERA